MKSLYFILSCVFIFSCAVKESKRNLVVYSTYKSHNLNFIPYSYNNINNDFLGYDEDLMSIKFDDTLNLSMICDYYNGNFTTTIESDQAFVKDLEVTVISSKNGPLKRRNQTAYDLKRNRLSFSLDFTTNERKDIVEKLKGDTVKVMIENRKFEFICPKT